MTVLYKVRVYNSMDGTEYIYEPFETKNDADKYWEELQENPLLDKLPCDVATMAYSECYRGVWVPLFTRTVVRNE